MERHAAAHLPARIVQAQQRQDLRDALDIFQQLRAANAATLEVLRLARDEHDGRIVLQAVDRLQRQIELVHAAGQASDLAELEVRIEELESSGSALWHGRANS